MSPKLIALAWATSTLCASIAQAGTLSPMFSLSGFGTLGVVNADADNADFVGNFFQPNGAGQTRRWSADVDSKLGVQLDARFSDKLSAVVQVVAQHRYDNTYVPQLEWGNVKYQFTPELGVRLGRTVAGPFMQSESRLVGYSNPWVRPPMETYGMLPITNKDGIDVAYQFQLGEATNAVQISYGESSPKLPGGGGIKAKNFFEINNAVEYGATSIHVGYTAFRFDFHTPGLDNLFSGFTQLGDALSMIPGQEAAAAQAHALVDQYQLSNTPYSVVSVGVNYDPGAGFLMAEWSHEQSGAVISNTTAWYISGGYRIGNFTPYLTLAQVRANKPNTSGLSTTGLPALLVPDATALNGGLDAVINAFMFSQKSMSAGVRWDFMRNSALKLQYDQLRTGAGSGGRLSNLQPGFQPGEKINVFSAAVEFVF
jgi:hypothetical protein